MILHYKEKWLTPDELYAEVEEMLLSFGLTPDMKCGRQLAQAIVLWKMEEKETGLLPLLSKTIYPEIGKHWGATWQSVERNCRFAIEKIESTDVSRARARIVLKCPISEKLLTNSQFIALAAAAIPSKKLLF